jgi:hypothetical protein
LIDNTALEAILTTATDISTVVEVYSSDAAPTVDGFDPTNALGLYAAVSGITFMGEPYRRLVKSIGNISKPMGEGFANASVEFSNTSREIADFEFNGGGFEGCVLVIRVISRSLSVSLATSKIEFVGRCERPDGGDKESLSVKATHILGSLDVLVPRRKYAPIDTQGRVASDPEFEGFVNMPREGDTTYSVRVSQRSPWGLLAGVVGYFFFKKHKTVTKTLHWSSFSDLDANKSVAVVVGRAQLVGIKLAYGDLGVWLQTVTGFCDGEISALSNFRVLDSRLTIADTGITLGKAGVLNGNDPTYISTSYYSRTATLRANLGNSTIDEVDPAPDIVALIDGLVMPVPTAGVWGGNVWTNNPIAHVRYFCTNADYFNLPSTWMWDEQLEKEYDFCFETIFNTEIADFTFVEEG